MTLGLERFSDTVVITVDGLVKFITNYFDMDMNDDLKNALSQFVGRPRHFFDGYLGELSSMMKDHPPQSKADMSKLLLDCSKRSKEKLVLIYKAL
jgi:hypothetical protein